MNEEGFFNRELTEIVSDLIDDYDRLVKESKMRELHHFETEEALTEIYDYVYFIGDELDHEDILAMIPDDIKQ